MHTASPSTSNGSRLPIGFLIRLGKIRIRKIIYLYFSKNDIRIKSFFNFIIA